MATKQAQKYKEQGNEAFKKGDHGKAIEFYTYATECDPKNPIFYTNRATAYLKMGKLDKSLRDANKAIGCDAKWQKGYYRAGLALQEMGRLDEAVKTFRKAYDLDNKNQTWKSAWESARVKANAGKSKAELLKMDGNELFKVGKQEEAIKLYTRAIDSCSKEEAMLKADILANRAACYRQLYNPDQVVRDCSEALDLNPNHAKAFIRRAQAYESLERYDKALQDFDRANIVAPNTPVAYQGSARVRKAIKTMKAKDN